MGALRDYREPKPIEGTYSYSVSGTTVTLINGSGGVGFVVRDPEGTLIGFSNNPVFEVNEKASRALLDGKASIYVVEADGTEHICTDMFSEGTLDEKFAALDRLLAGAKRILDKSTYKNSSVGYLRDEFVNGLIPIYDDLRERRDNGKVNESTILDDYNNLNTALIPVYNLTINEDMTSPVVDNGIYCFTSNLRNKGVGISADGANRRLGRVASGKVNTSWRNQWWRLEPAAEDGYYYLHNIATDLYMGTVSTDNTYIPLEDESRKVPYLVTYRELGGIALSANGVDYCSLRDNGSAIVRGRSTTTPGAEGSDTDDHRDGRWKLTLIDQYDRQSALFDLGKMIIKSEELLIDPDTPEGEMKTDLTDVLNRAKELYNSNESTTRQLEEVCDQLTEVYDILNGYVNNVADRLIEMIERTRALARTIGEVSAESYPMITMPRANYNFLFTNGITPTGSNKQTKWTVLFDNSLATVFSTKTATNTSDGDDPYIRATLPGTAVKDIDMQITYTTSSNATETWAPTAFVIETSIDGVSDWTECQRVEEGLPVTPNTSYTTEWFKFKAGQQHVRLKVSSSRHNADDAEPVLVEGHPFFNLSELNISYMLPTFTPDTDNYPKATEQIMHDAWIATLDAERVMQNQHTRADIQRAYDELVPYYESLLQLNGKSAMEITNVSIRCTDDSDHALVVYDNPTDDNTSARSPIGYKIDMLLEGLPAGYPVRLAEISFTNTESGVTYSPKGTPTASDHGFFTVNYPQDMPLGRYTVNVVLPESDEYEAYSGEMPRLLLDVYMKNDDRMSIVTFEGLQSLDVTHVGSLIESQHDCFIYRLPSAPADDVTVYHKVTPADEGVLRTTVRRVPQASGMPAGYSIYDHDEGVVIPRTNPAGTISFIVEKAGVQTPPTEVAYSGLPRYDLRSGIYLVGSFCDFEVNENAKYVGPLPTEGETIYEGIYVPDETPTDDVVLCFAQYTLADNYTKFYGPRDEGTDFLSSSHDVTLSKDSWKGGFGYNSSRWIFSPDAINAAEGLEFVLDFSNTTVTFGEYDGTTGVIVIEAPEDDALYYDLHGLRIKNPAPGMYIRLKDGVVAKVVIKGTK